MHILEPGQLNTYDVLISDDVVFTHAALDEFIAGPKKGKSAKGAASSDEAAEAPVAEAPVAEAVEAAEEPAVDTTKKAKAVDTAKKPKKAAAKAEPEPAAEVDEAADTPADEADEEA